MPRVRDETAAAREAARRARRAGEIAAREHMSPSGPAVDRFRLATWNLNSLRARRPAVERFLERAAPDVLCLQETKAPTVSAEAAAMFERHGYHVVAVGAGSYNGVAIASRHRLADVVTTGEFGDEHLDREPRALAVVVDGPVTLRVATVYVPHGREVGHWHYDYKLAFLGALADRVTEWLDDGHLAITGDVNVAPTDSDIFHPDAFVGLTHVTPAERDAWAGVLARGLVDVDVAAHGADARRFTWWNHGHAYRTNLGMRIDAIAVNPALAAALDVTWIDHTERAAERPSDHAALIADFDLAGLTSEDSSE